ncbi:MAG: DUF2339 domain-containing protein [Verrucomicrobiota bacterium]
MEAFGVILLLFIAVSLILPWLNLAGIRSRKNEIERLQRDLEQLRRENRRDREEPIARLEPEAKPLVGDVSPDNSSDQAPPPLPKTSMPADVPESKSKEVYDLYFKGRTKVSGTTEETAASPEPTGESKTKQVTASPQEWFSKIAVWVGGVALLMAGFYMIKYSIDSGWLTPAVRVWLTAGFGLALCAGGFVVSLKSTLKGTQRIGQALSGAGVACLYFAAYAAVHLYGFFDPKQGFGCMVLITVLAVALSLKVGAPVALMGLVGGFLTPLLMSTGSADTVMLFNYLFLLFCGAQFLCVRRGWWRLLLLSLVGTYVWSAAVIVWNLSGAIDHLEGAMFFVLGVCFVNGVWAFMGVGRELGASAQNLLAGARFLVWGGGLAQSFLLVWIEGFAGVDMALFSILSIGALLLAIVREKEFVWASWLALAAVIFATLSNPAASLGSWFLWPLGLMLLFYVIGHWRGLDSNMKLSWYWLSALSITALTPVLFANREILAAGAIPFAAFWLVLAVGCGTLLILASEHLLHRDKQCLKEVSSFQLLAVLLLVFGMWTYLPQDYLAYGIGTLLAVSVIYWTRRDLSSLELLIGILSAAWVVVMLPLAGEALAYFFRDELIDAARQDLIAVGAWAIGITAGLISLHFTKEKLEPPYLLLTRCFVGFAGLYGLVASYQFLDQSVMPSSWPETAIEGGLTSILSVLVVLFFRYTTRSTAGYFVGSLLAILAALRIVLFHFFGSGAEGESFFLNALFFQFGIPFFCVALLAWMPSTHRLRHIFQGAAMVLGFVWTSFLVQDYFGGTELFSRASSNTHLYTYSVVWLVLAVVYQALGLWKNQGAIHIGSLVLLLLTVGKVFLIDAAQLEGLFRVLSFLGLGVALIGISFFYNKVVFARSLKAEV